MKPLVILYATRSMATDTSHDYEFTDWRSVDSFVDDVLSDHFAHTAARDAPAPA